MIEGNNIRLPKITRFISSLDVVGDIGITITDSVGSHTHAYYRPHVIGAAADGGGGNTLQFYRVFGNNGGLGAYETSASSGTETQPRHVRLALYIQVYHATTTLSTAQMSSLLNQITDLNNKITELTTRVNSYEATNFGAPDHSRRVTLTPAANDTVMRYTPSENGYISAFFMRRNDGHTQIDLTVGGVTYSNWSRPGSYYVNGHMSVIMPVRAGQEIVITKVSGNWNYPEINWVYFIPCS